MPGKQWNGTAAISSKHLRPAWMPPQEVKRDKPSLPDLIAGGAPNNPMGEAALVLDRDEYAIHGTNVPTSIGRAASYGCIRMHNEDILDLVQARARGHAGRCDEVIRNRRPGRRFPNHHSARGPARRGHVPQQARLAVLSIPCLRRSSASASALLAASVRTLTGFSTISAGWISTALRKDRLVHLTSSTPEVLKRHSSRQPPSWHRTARPATMSAFPHRPSGQRRHWPGGRWNRCPER